VEEQMKKISRFVIAISMISAPLPALATHNLQPRPELTEEQKADDLMNKCLMWSLHPDMSYAGLEWHATYCDGHQFESATPASNDTQTSTGQLMASYQPTKARCVKYGGGLPIYYDAGERGERDCEDLGYIIKTLISDGCHYNGNSWKCPK
jgi:hypothetical protein